MDAFAVKHRKSRGFSNDGNMFLTVVWMTATEKSLFPKFLHVVKIGITFKTDTRGFPFPAMTGKTRDNESPFLPE
jgi:hypothetical protein